MLQGGLGPQSAQGEHFCEASEPHPVSSQLPPGMVEVHVEKGVQVDQALNDAICQVMKAATKHRVGIMVTRLDAGWYMVRAHPEVPFGLTRQQHC